MSKDLNNIQNEKFNKEIEDLIDSRINDMAEKLRKENSNYKDNLNKIESLQKSLKKELNKEQIAKVNEIIDSLNYISGIELITMYKMAINDFNNIKI